MVWVTRFELAFTPWDVPPVNQYDYFIRNEYLNSISGLGDQIWTGDLAVPNRARYQLRHAQIFLSYHDFSILFDI